MLLQYVAAMADFTAAIREDPHLFVSYLHIALLLRLCNPKAALSNINAFLDHKNRCDSTEQLALAFYVRGLIKYRMGTDPEAAVAGVQAFVF